MADVLVEDSASLGTVANTDSIYVVSGTQDIVTNVDQSALAGGLTIVDVAPRFTASFGTLSVPFKADIDQGSGIFRFAGSGQCFYHAGGGSAVCTKLRVLNGTMNLITGGTITTAECMRGRMISAAAVTITTLLVGGADVRIEGTTGTASTTVEMTDGSLYMRKGIAGGGTLSMYGGELVIDCGTNTIPTLNIYGGTLHLRNCGTITTMNLVKGDSAKIVVARPITITTLNVWASVRGASAFTHISKLTIGTLNWIGDIGEIL